MSPPLPAIFAMQPFARLIAPIIASSFLTLPSHAQGLRSDYERAAGLGDHLTHLYEHNAVSYRWSADGKSLAFQAPSSPEPTRWGVLDLADGKTDWVTGYQLFTRIGPPPTTAPAPPDSLPRKSSITGGAVTLTFANRTKGTIELLWLDPAGKRNSYGKIAPGESHVQATHEKHVWVVTDASGHDLAGIVSPHDDTLVPITGLVASPQEKPEGRSPDGKWEAFLRNHNLYLKRLADGAQTALTSDGTPGYAYEPPMIWSPDSKTLAAFHTNRPEPRVVTLVQSSPPDQLQPKLIHVPYPKPGDPIPHMHPVLFRVATRAAVPVDESRMPNPWEIDHAEWSADSRELLFLYNQRGHQVMRYLAADATTGKTRVVIEETNKTFIDYSSKTYLHLLPKTGEILWASERDGWNHLYLIREQDGSIKNRITTGAWNVKEVMSVDEDKRTILFRAVGIHPDQDPYYVHWCRVNFDGSGLVALTAGDGTHDVHFSPDGNYFIDQWSRVDQPDVTEVRRSRDGSLVRRLQEADDSEQRKTGWSRPERFHAKGRDGKTEIYGILVKPSKFNPSFHYPVIEYIYAGPHDAFVPKSYTPWLHADVNALAELGFIVVQIDGMGTNWRGKAFHDICWKNLADSGLPDRIAWIKAAAATRPWMDTGRVGIYGGSAGGQSALSALLHHGDFYKAGLADCGCHDNRIDKIWWNEAWMGWPVDESYAKNSNVTDAHLLTGKLMLTVGELDTNVDPSSTLQVANALEKADKDFDLVIITGSDHGAAESPYGRRRRMDFFVRNLLGREPRAEK